MCIRDSNSSNGDGDNNCIFLIFVVRKKGRGSHSIRTPVPTTDTIIAPARESLTYAEAQKLVEFEINGRVTRVNIQQPLKLVSKDEYEAVNGSVNNVCFYFLLHIYKNHIHREHIRNKIY